MLDFSQPDDIRQTAQFDPLSLFISSQIAPPEQRATNGGATSKGILSSGTDKQAINDQPTKDTAGLPLLILFNSTDLPIPILPAEQPKEKKQNPLDPKTAKLTHKDQNIKLFSNDGPTVALITLDDKSLTDSVIYRTSSTDRSKSVCSFSYKNRTQFERMEYKDPTNRVLLEVSKNAADGKFQLTIQTSPNPTILTLKEFSEPKISDDGVIEFVGDDNSKVTIDAQGRIIIGAPGRIEKSEQQVKVIVPNKLQEVYIGGRLIGKTFLDSEAKNHLFIQRDKTDPDRITRVGFTVGNNHAIFTPIGDGKWTAKVIGSVKLQGETVGTLSFDDNMNPTFKSMDRTVEVSEATLLESAPTLRNLLSSQRYFKAQFLLQTENKARSDFHHALLKEFKCESLAQIPKDEYEKRSKPFELQLKLTLLKLNENLDNESKYLQDVLAELERNKKTEASLTPKEIQDIWVNKMRETKLAYERLITSLKTEALPEALDILENWNLPVPPDCPVETPKDKNGQFVPAVGIKRQLKANADKIVFDFGTVPTLETLNRLTKSLEWCKDIRKQQHDLIVQRDLKIVIPAMIKQAGYPQTWLERPEGMSDEAHRDALLHMISVCDDVREFAGAIKVCRYSAKGVPFLGPDEKPKYPPNVKPGLKEEFEFKWPEKVSMSNEKTIKFVEDYQKWAAKEGKEFDEKMQKALQKFESFTNYAFYGNMPLKAYASFEKTGPKSGQLKEIHDTAGDGRREFNNLNGNFYVEKVGANYRLRTIMQPEYARLYNYQNIGNENIGLAKDNTEFYPPGTLIPFVGNGGKVRLVPIEELAELKQYQQFWRYTELAVSTLTDAAILVGGLGVGSLALFAGRAGLKALMTGTFRTIVGGSGFILTNSNAMTTDWGKTAHKVRSVAIMFDVSAGLLKSFGKAAPEAYKTIALTNLANSEWRIAKRLGTVLEKVDNVHKSKAYSRGMLGTEVAFLGILGREFYHKFDNTDEEINVKPGEVPKIKQLEDRKSPLFHHLILGRSENLDGAKTPVDLMLNIAVAELLGRYRVAKDYFDTLGKSKLTDTDRQKIQAIRAKLDNLVFGKKPDNEDQQKWLDDRTKEKDQRIEEFKLILQSDSESKDVKFAALMAVYALSTPDKNIDGPDKNKSQPKILELEKLINPGQPNRFDLRAFLDDCVAQGNPDLKLMAVEMQMRLEVPERGALYMARTLVDLIDSPNTSEDSKIKAIENLTRIWCGLHTYENGPLKLASVEEKRVYIATSADCSANVLRHFITTVAGDKNQPPNVRVMAAKCIASVNSTGNRWDSGLVALVKEYYQGPNTFAQNQLTLLSKSSQNDTVASVRMDATSALLALDDLGELSTPQARSKRLIDTFRMCIKRIEDGKNVNTEDIVAAAECISLMTAEDIKHLTPEERKLIIGVLELPEYSEMNLLKTQILRKASHVVSPETKALMEEAILKLITPPTATNFGTLSSRATNEFVRKEAIKALVDARLVSERSIALLKTIALPSQNPKIPPVESSASVRLQALHALLEQDPQTFYEVANICFLFESNPAIRTLIDTYKIAHRYPVRNLQKRAELAKIQGDKYEDGNWEKKGPAVLKPVTDGYGTIEPATVKVKTKIGDRFIGYGGKDEMDRGPRYAPIYSESIIVNPKRIEHLQNNLFRKVRQSGTPDDAAEQAVFYLVTQLSSNAHVEGIPADQRVRVLREALDTLMALVSDKGDNLVPAITIERFKRLIKDTHFSPFVRLEMLVALKQYVDRNTTGGKNSELREDFANYLAGLLDYDVDQVVNTEKSDEIRKGRRELRFEILRQMNTYRGEYTNEALDIVSGRAKIDVEVRRAAADLLLKLRDSVKSFYEEAQPIEGHDKPVLADRIIAAFGSGMSCQEIVGTIFSCTKAQPIGPSDPRLSSVRLALGAKGLIVELNPKVYTHAAGTPNVEITTRVENGAEMIRLAAALVMLQPEHTGFSYRDKTDALAVCIRLMTEGKEEGYRKDARELLARHIKNNTNDLGVPALVFFLLDAEKNAANDEKAEKPETILAAKQLLFNSLPDGLTEVRLPDGRMLRFNKIGLRVQVEESSDNKLLRASIVSIAGGPERTYTESLLAELDSPTVGLQRKLEISRRIIAGEPKDYVKPTLQQQTLVVEKLANSCQVFDGGKNTDTGEYINFLKNVLYKDGDFAQRADIPFMDSDKMDSIETKFMVALADRAIDGDADARKMLLQLAKVNREKLMKCVFHAIPYTRRIPMDFADMRAKQVQFHLDCYGAGERDLGFDVLEKGKAERLPPHAKRSYDALKSESSGAVQIYRSVFDETAALMTPDYFNPKVKDVKLQNVHDLKMKVNQKYLEVDKKKMEIWTDLIVSIASQGNNELSTNEYAIIAGAYLEATPILGSDSASVKRIPIEQVAKQLEQIDDNKLKLALVKPFVSGLTPRLSVEDGLKQSNLRASTYIKGGSKDTTFNENYKKLTAALSGPLKMSRFKLYFDGHGKDYLDAMPETVEAAYKEMSEALVDAIKLRRQEKEVNGKLSPEAQKLIRDTKSFLDIAPPEVLLNVAGSLLDSGTPWAEELAFFALVKVLRDGNAEQKALANARLRKAVDNPAGDKIRRKTSIQNAIAEVTRDSVNPNPMIEQWKQDKAVKGPEAELQLQIRAIPAPERKGIRKTMIAPENAAGQDFRDKIGLSAYVGAFLEDPAEIEAVLDDILVLIGSKDTQSYLIKKVNTCTWNERKLLVITLKKLKDKDVHQDIQKQLEQRLKELP